MNEKEVSVESRKRISQLIMKTPYTMRLGQFLINCTTKDIYYLSDQELEATIITYLKQISPALFK